MWLFIGYNSVKLSFCLSFKVFALPEQKKHSSENSCIEQAIKGHYVIDTKEIIAEAWLQTKKSRLSINVGLLFVILLGTLVSLIASNFVGGVEAVLSDPKASTILNVLVTVVIWPFLAGIEMMGVYHSLGKATQPKMVFSFLSRGSWVALCALLTSLLISLGIQLFIIPGVFLAVVLSLTIPLVIDKKLSPSNAIKVSIQALRFKFFQLLSLYMALFMFLIVLLLPIAFFAESSFGPITIALFLFGMTYLAPLYFNVKGILYRNIFGVTGQESNPQLTESLRRDGPVNSSGKNDKDDTFSA
jgi:hypothetical protein